MEILSHRGYWLQSDEKNTSTAFARSFDLGFGTETDVRDHNGELIIAHDMPAGDEMRFEEFLDILDGRDLPLAINIKADGLGKMLAEAMSRRNLTRWFTFDMSGPELIRQSALQMPVFTRLSEHETQPVLYASSTGVWLDAFESLWFDAKTIQDLLDDGKSVCVVSPELHGRDPADLWRLLRAADLGQSHLMVCTDQPEELASFMKRETL